MQLLLVRHGNTFEEGSPSVWIGNKVDLPLTAKGVSQAESLGSLLRNFRIPVAAIYTGPLTRHRQHGAILAQALGRSQTNLVDDRLREIDYGAWEGKSDEAIRQEGHEAELKAWNSNATWPKSGVWNEDEQSLETRVDDFLASAEHCAGEHVTLLGVTSGGVLRYFYKHALLNRSDSERQTSKVATGNVCGLYLQSTSWKILFWNVPPNEVPI